MSVGKATRSGARWRMTTLRRAIPIIVGLLVLLSATSGRAETGVGSVVTLVDGPPGCTVSATSAELALANGIDGGMPSARAANSGSIRVEVQTISGLRGGEICDVWVGLSASNSPIGPLTHMWWATSPSASGTNPFTIPAGAPLSVEARLDHHAVEGIRARSGSVTVLLSSDRARD